MLFDSRGITLPAEVLTAQRIFVNHSGGKDSQAMLAYLTRLGLGDKLVVIHSDLGEMEWEPMSDWIEQNSLGKPVFTIVPKRDFFQLCRDYKRLPSGLARFCTSELKTNPLNKFIKNYCLEHGLTNVVSAIGLRAEESKGRANKPELKPNNSRTHTQHDWLPIKHFTLDNVWAEIANAGQVPHRIYNQGFSRLSCAFCVFARIEEHRLAAKLKPELGRKIAMLEQELGKSIRLKVINKVKHPKFITEYTSLACA